MTCVCRGVPEGWGEPVFDRLEAMLAHAMLSIPATKVSHQPPFRQIFLNGIHRFSSLVDCRDLKLGRGSKEPQCWDQSTTTCLWPKAASLGLSPTTRVAFRYSFHPYHK